MHKRSLQQVVARRAVVALLFLLNGVSFSADDTCLVLVGESIGSSGNNNYCYQSFSERKVTVAKGDVLVYEVFQPASNSTPQAALDIKFVGGGILREMKCLDRANQYAHPSTHLPESVGHWFQRQVPLVPAIGKTTAEWNAALEGDPKGVYVLCLDNIAIVHADGTRTVIYANGPPTINRKELRNNYAESVLLTDIPRTSVTNAGLAAWLAQVWPPGAPLAPQAVAHPAPQPPPARKVRPKPTAKPQPLPESKLIEEARALVRDFFKADYTQVAGGQRAALITRLMKEAAETNTDLDLKYALLDEALSLARQSGRFDLALNAIDDVARAFQVDGWKLKVDVLNKAAPDDPKEGNTLVACCLEQLQAAFDEDRYPEAQRILTITRECATRLKDEQTLALLQKQSSDLAEWRLLYSRYDAARKTLEEKPNDGAAHLVAGTYLCFVKKNLEEGLPHLAAGSDPALKALATKEIAHPAAVATRLVLADAWFDLAQKSGSGKSVMQGLAAKHYEAILPQLEGEEQAKVAKRLTELRPGFSADVGGAGTVSAAGLAPVVWLSFDKKTLYQKDDHLLAKDLSGNDLRVVLIGCTSGPGVFGDALVLDGKQSRAVVVDAGKLDFSGKDFTVAVWFRPDALPMREQMIFEKAVWGQAEAFQITLYKPTTVRFNFPAITPGVNHETTLVPGTWYHYAMVVQAGKAMTFYENGKVVSSTPMTKPIGAGSSPIYLGHRRGGSLPFAGAIDEFMLIPRALTAAEVAGLAQRPTSLPARKAIAP